MKIHNQNNQERMKKAPAKPTSSIYETFEIDQGVPNIDPFSENWTFSTDQNGGNENKLQNSRNKG